MGRGLLIWFLIMAVETIHGVLRGLLLAPRVGDAMAARIGWPVAAVLVLGISLATIRWSGVAGTTRLLGLGALWAALTVLFELAIGAARGLDAASLLAALNPLTGSVAWSAGLMLLMPLVAARLRGLP